ncbi:alanyl-tRNA editing protein [Archangium minus]|uniref:Alanyl-tRNA editing protein n=1 Tax=Archangium minus TaxID=83450 RepID=A0ABY9WLR1_9BACT|nr:alanyl-tRNA editing protein [Archangium violaceum]WNG43365.1 alanyl-tRNA editing protein [Archangium minus]
MTRKVFWFEPYRTELETRVRDVNGDNITLEETIFYALSGGQESDHGTIGGHPVREARKSGLDILYTLEAGHGLKPGDPVAIRIDWERRYRLMRLHFAAELVLELVYQKLGSVNKIGAHIAQDKARIDFEYERNITSLLPELTSQVQEIVSSDRPIISAFSDEAAGRRYWEIEGFSRVPCGGTHLKKTGEVGAVELKRKNLGKSKERIEIHLKHDPTHHQPS